MSLALNRYRRRITGMVALQIGARGLAIGAWFGVGAVLLDYFSTSSVPSWLPYVLPGVGLIAGLLWSRWKVPNDAAIARSLDRRMGLEDRVASARELSGVETAFDALLNTSAQAALNESPPKQAFPLRWSPSLSHAMAGILVFGVLVFLAVQQPWVSGAERKQRANMKMASAEIERIQKEIIRQPQPSPEAEALAKSAAADLEKLQKQLDKERLSPQEAEKRAMEIANQLDKLEKSRRDENIDQAKQLESASQRLLEAKAREMAQRAPTGQDALRPSEATLNQENARKEQLEDRLAQLRKELENPKLTEAERRKIEAEMANLEKELNALRQLEDLRQEAKNLESQMQRLKAEQHRLEEQLADPALSQKEREELEAQLDENKVAQKEVAKRQEELEKEAELKKQIQQAMEELSKNKNYQELQRLAQEMMQKAEKQQMANAGQGDPPKPLTAEELQAMHDQIKALEEMLKDDELAQKMIDQMKAMLEQAKFGTGSCELNHAMGMG